LAHEMKSKRLNVQTFPKSSRGMVCTIKRARSNEKETYMKSSIIAIFAITAFAGTVFAADVIEMKKGVKFNHKAHQELLKDCTKCHAAAAGGKIEGFGKDYAHKSCKGCHSEGKKGPTACKECHK